MKCKIALIAALVANLLFSSVTFAHSSDTEKYTNINSAGYSERCISSLDDEDSVIYYSGNPFKNYRGNKHYKRGSREDNPFRDVGGSNHNRGSRDDNPFKNYRGSNRHDRGHDDDYYKPQF